MFGRVVRAVATIALAAFSNLYLTRDQVVIADSVVTGSNIVLTVCFVYNAMRYYYIAKYQRIDGKLVVKKTKVIPDQAEPKPRRKPEM